MLHDPRRMDQATHNHKSCSWLEVLDSMAQRELKASVNLKDACPAVSLSNVPRKQVQGSARWTPYQSDTMGSSFFDKPMLCPVGEGEGDEPYAEVLPRETDERYTSEHGLGSFVIVRVRCEGCPHLPDGFVTDHRRKLKRL